MPHASKSRVAYSSTAMPSSEVTVATARRHRACAVYIRRAGELQASPLGIESADVLNV
jgi:hypothetical protein